MCQIKTNSTKNKLTEIYWLSIPITYDKNNILIVIFSLQTSYLKNSKVVGEIKCSLTFITLLKNGVMMYSSTSIPVGIPFTSLCMTEYLVVYLLK